MRKQALVDLHDYLDVHRSLRSVVARLRSDVSEGSYRPRESEVVTLEKRLGIPRRLVIPSAVDALVLQAVVQFIEPRLIRAAPTERAYYGRSHQPPSIDGVDESYPYAWWLLWPSFQERIWEFAETKEWVVMTDVANYFDSIPLARLRNKITALGLFEEEVVDLLFFLLEAFVWRPQYIPLSGVGLPQIDFDAPRLLAHAFLYDVDEFLERHTKGSFVRWMDDIDFGVESQAAGKALLGQLDTLMASHGIRINAGKSVILSGEQALEHLWMNENRRLTLLTKLLRGAVNPKASASRIADYAFRRFRTFYREPRKGAWEKILKRYLTLFRRTEHRGAQRWVAELLRDSPATRPWIFSYLHKLGYTPRRFRLVEDFLLSDDCADDVSLFAGCKLLVDWEVPSRSVYVKRACALSRKVAVKFGGAVSSFAGGLWLVAKYGGAKELAQYLHSTRGVWRRSEWGARQAASVTPLLEPPDEKEIARVIRSAGLLDGLAVLASTEAIRKLDSPDKQLRPYLTDLGSFSLPKYLVSRALLDGALTPVERTKLLVDLEDVVTDPVFRVGLGMA